MKLRWLLAAALVLAFAAGGAALLAAKARPRPVVQPIPFNHAVHVKGEEMACSDCHSGHEEARAGFADIRSCHECHKQPQGDSPSQAQEKVRELGKARRQVPWVSVNRNAGHVYFSHRAHVTLGKMTCEECHGDVGERTEAVAVPTRALHSMDRCMDCHRERGATLQCVACHD